MQLYDCGVDCQVAFAWKSAFFEGKRRALPWESTVLRSVWGSTTGWLSRGRHPRCPLGLEPVGSPRRWKSTTCSAHPVSNLRWVVRTFHACRRRAMAAGARHGTEPLAVVVQQQSWLSGFSYSSQGTCPAWHEQRVISECVIARVVGCAFLAFGPQRVSWALDTVVPSGVDGLRS